jgi:hypothetical protein
MAVVATGVHLLADAAQEAAPVVAGSIAAALAWPRFVSAQLN